MPSLSLFILFSLSFVAQHIRDGFCCCCCSKFRKVYHTVLGPKQSELCAEFINSFITCQASSRAHCCCIVAELNILNFDVSPIGIREQKLLIRLFSVIQCDHLDFLLLSYSAFVTFLTFLTQLYSCTCTRVPWKKARN